LSYTEDNGITEIYLPDHTTDDGPISNISYLLTYNSEISNVSISIVNNSLIIEALPDWFGNVTINIEVSDDYVTENYTYIIEFAPINDAPFVTEPIEDFDIIVNGEDSTTVDLTNHFDDVDSELTYTSTGDQNISVNIQANGTVIFTPAVNWSGTETITFTASDEEYSVSDDVVVTVYDPYIPCHAKESPYNTTSQINPVIFVHVTDESEIDTGSIRLYVNGVSVFYSLDAIPGGYNVSYIYETGFSNGEEVICRIVANDIYSNTLDYFWQFTVNTSNEFTIQLHEGWNLISVPLVQSNTSVESVLSSIGGKYDIVKFYNSTDMTDPWKTYAPSRPVSLSDLIEINHKMSLWVHITATGTTTLVLSGTAPSTTTIHLNPGWNFVSYPSLTAGMTVNDAFTGTSWDRVETYDGNNPYLIAEMNGFEYMVPGQGYWVHVTSDCNWIVDW
jgi:hypothetical protein